MTTTPFIRTRYMFQSHQLTRGEKCDRLRELYRVWTAIVPTLIHRVLSVPYSWAMSNVEIVLIHGIFLTKGLHVCFRVSKSNSRKNWQGRSNMLYDIWRLLKWHSDSPFRICKRYDHTWPPTFYGFVIYL